MAQNTKINIELHIQDVVIILDEIEQLESLDGFKLSASGERDHLSQDVYLKQLELMLEWDEQKIDCRLVVSRGEEVETILLKNSLGVVHYYEHWETRQYERVMMYDFNAKVLASDIIKEG